MAGRIRTVKPELVGTQRIAKLSDAAFRLFVGCYGLVDDAGTCQAGAAYLNGQIFFERPRSPAVVGRLLGELEAARCIDLYESDHASYLSIVGWSEKDAPTHQRIDKPQRPRYPQPRSVRSWNEFEEHSEPDPIRSDPTGIRPGQEPDAKTTPAPKTEPLPPKLPKTPDPALDPEIRARRELAEEKWQQLEDARADVAERLGVKLRPLPAFDQGRTALGMRILETGDVDRARADCDHVIAVRHDEAIASKSTKWLTGSMFEERSWRVAIGMSLDEAKRTLPARASEHPQQLRIADDYDPPPFIPAWHIESSKP